MENIEMPASRENEIVIVMSGMGMVMGRVAESGKGIIINPRLVRIMPGENNKVEIRLINLIGNPEVFYINGAPHYRTEDNELCDLYFEVVTGITLSRTPEVIH
jgi:hypothetical protein